MHHLESDELRLLIGRVDVFGSQMAQVTCLAPTSMDARVSRSVAVSATAVGDTLRNERDRRLDGDDRQFSSAIVDRCAALAVAVTDLGNHVELL